MPTEIPITIGGGTETGQTVPTPTGWVPPTPTTPPDFSAWTAPVQSEPTGINLDRNETAQFASMKPPVGKVVVRKVSNLRGRSNGRRSYSTGFAVSGDKAGAFAVLISRDDFKLPDGNRHTTYTKYEWRPLITKSAFEPSGLIKEKVHKGPAKLWMYEPVSGRSLLTDEAWAWTRDAVYDWNSFVSLWNPNGWPISSRLQQMALGLWYRWNPFTGVGHPLDSLTFRNLIHDELAPTAVVPAPKQEAAKDLALSRPPSFGEMLLAASQTVAGSSYFMGLTSQAVTGLARAFAPSSASSTVRKLTVRERILAQLRARKKRK